MSLRQKITLFIGTTATLALLVLSVILIRTYMSPSGEHGETKKTQSKKIKIEKFKNLEELKQYLQSAQNQSGGGIGMARLEMATDQAIAPNNAGAPSDKTAQSADRFSQTNVQVMGIDEPDIVKNNGQIITVSSEQRFFIDPVIMRGPATEPGFAPSEKLIAPAPEYKGKTAIINALPATTLRKLSEIEESGDLFLHNDTLVILTMRGAIAYNIADKEKPAKLWEQLLQNNTRIVESRLKGDTLYLVTSTYINTANPCPVEILRGTRPTQVVCSDIIRPPVLTQSNETVTVSKLNLQNGEVSDKTSFLSAGYENTVYMSDKNIYVTYTQQTDYFNFYYNFFRTDGRNLVDGATLERLEKVNGYDISTEAKAVELGKILNTLYSDVDQDGRLKKQTEIENSMKAYARRTARDYEKTAILRFNNDTLDTTATAEIPGAPLNQFSIDEYNDNLRIATTVGRTPFLPGSETANDVYVLDSNLNQIGAVKDLGLTERIYSARFIGDKGYLVTFRQIDPFYILDLSNPRAPKMTGELKIPGFSSYLHPLSENVMLGIGREDANVKATLFDISNPTQPRELDTYFLKEYNSDILQTHRAFLHDKEKGIFFVPANNGGYIFNYANNKLNLVKTINLPNTRRAIYINDTMYIISGDTVAAYSQANWSEIGRVTY